MKAARQIGLKRAYEPAVPGDGYRVLVDRLWPRGVSKQALPLDLWDKDLAPTPKLRQWFGHDPRKRHQRPKISSTRLSAIPNPAPIPRPETTFPIKPPEAVG
jgi:uncharacterized protein DUF488